MGYRLRAISNKAQQQAIVSVVCWTFLILIVWGLLQPLLFDIYFSLADFSPAQQQVFDVTRHPDIYFIIIIISAVVALLSLLIHIKLQYKHLWTVIVGKTRPGPSGWVKFSLIGVLLAIVTSTVLFITGIDSGISLDRVFNKQTLSIPTVMIIVRASVIVAPLFEELLFRGYFQSLTHYFGIAKGWCVFVSSALWTLIHGQYHWQALVILFCLGILLGIARFYFKSLWATLIIHSGFNLTTLCLLLLQSNH